MDDGYSIHPHLFDRERMRRIIGALTGQSVARSRAGARHVLAVPAIHELAAAERLLEIARGYVGKTAVPFRATLFDKSLEANWLVPWHQDTALPVRERMGVMGWGPWTRKGSTLHAIAPASALEGVVALRVHLDDSESENGPLRVLPGTHIYGVLTRKRIDHFAQSVAPIDCVCDAGGVVAMRSLTVHASSKACTARPRRVLHIEYAASTRLDSGIDLDVG